MRIEIIAARSDNYSFWLASESGAEGCVLVDPCRPEPTLAAVERLGRRPVAILTTHHHHDHIGGHQALLERFPGLRVYGHRSETARIPGLDSPVDEGDQLQVAGLRFRVMFIPGHTTGHVAYIHDEGAFVGDTLFGAGCGRLLGGTAEQLHHSLNVRLRELPLDLPLYFCHEYTLSNLAFAQSLEPENERIRLRRTEVEQRRSKGEVSVPSTLREELETNPFLRVHMPSVRRALGMPTSTDEEVFAALRALKDRS